MKKIIAIIGISCSGKSTLAKQLNESTPNSIIVNRDKLREMLFGYTEETIHKYYQRNDIHLLEKQVSEYENLLIERALNFDQVVIVDNTHVKLKYLNVLKNYNVPIEYKLVECDLNTALERDQNRLRKVGGDVIKQQYNNLQILKKNFDFKDYVPTKVNQIVQNTDLPTAYCFDIDGTLAKMVSGRSPYDWKRVDEDALNYPVYLAYKAHKIAGHKIIICTGRDGECEELTKEWLANHSIQWDEYHTRAKGDQRKDSIVKEEMWRDISTRYNISALYDDRNQVVDHARSLGLSVFQVNYGNF